MMAPKSSLFLAELKRRNLYFVAIVFVLGCGGPKVPADQPQAMEWHFDEPQPDWKVMIPPHDPAIAPAEVSHTGDALRVTLPEQSSGDFLGVIYTDLPDLNLAEWDTVVVRTRSQVDITGLFVGINLKERSSPPTNLSGSAFKNHNWQRQGRPDGTERTYRVPVDDSRFDWVEPVRHLGLEFFIDQPGSIDLLSVRLVPKAADLRVSESTDEKCLGLQTLNPGDLPNPTTVITFAHVDAAQTEAQGDWAALPEH
jgi:hypothetical protein